MFAAGLGVVPSLAIVLGVALGTYAMRASVIVVLGDRTLPAPLERSLRYVGPAVLAALTVSLAAGSSDGGAPSLSWPEAAALGVAFVVALRWRNLLAVLLSAMAVLWIASAIA